MAFSAFRPVRNLCRVGRNLSNKLSRVTSISSNRRCFLSTFNNDLPNLFRREDGNAIATSSTNGKGDAVETRMVTAVLRFGRGPNAIASQAEQYGQASVFYDNHVNFSSFILVRITRVLGRVFLLFHARRGIRSLCLYRVTKFWLNVTAYRRRGDTKVLFRRPVGNLATFLIHRLNRQAHISGAGIDLFAFPNYACAYLARSFAGHQDL